MLTCKGLWAEILSRNKKIDRGAMRKEFEIFGVQWQCHIIEACHKSTIFLGHVLLSPLMSTLRFIFQTGLCYSEIQSTLLRLTALLMQRWLSFTNLSLSSSVCLFAFHLRVEWRAFPSSRRTCSCFQSSLASYFRIAKLQRLLSDYWPCCASSVIF